MELPPALLQDLSAHHGRTLADPRVPQSDWDVPATISKPTAETPGPLPAEQLYGTFILVSQMIARGVISCPGLR